MNSVLTTEQKQDIIHKLHSYRIDKGNNGEPLSLAKLKLSSGRTPGQIEVPVSYFSDLCNDKMTTGGKQTPIADKYFISIAAMVGYKFDDNTINHFDTHNYLSIKTAFEDAINTGLPVAIDGDTRYGKTYSSWRFKQTSPYSQYIYIVNCDSDLTCKGFIEELAEVIGIKVSGSVYKIRKAIVKKLKSMDQRCLLIIDESENLKDGSWGSVKSILDHLKGVVGIALMGANGFEATLRKKADKEKGCFPQIVGRIKEGLGFVPLTEYRQDRKELYKICAVNGITDKVMQDTFIDQTDSVGYLLRSIDRTKSLAQEAEQEITKSFILTQFV